MTVLASDTLHAPRFKHIYTPVKAIHQAGSIITFTHLSPMIWWWDGDMDVYSPDDEVTEVNSKWDYLTGLHDTLPMYPSVTWAWPLQHLLAMWSNPPSDIRGHSTRWHTHCHIHWEDEPWPVERSTHLASNHSSWVGVRSWWVPHDSVSIRTHDLPVHQLHC